jgi:hypothetical protein
MSAGVDLGHEDLKLVKVNRVSDRKMELIDYTRVALVPETPRTIRISTSSFERH